MLGVEDVVGVSLLLALEEQLELTDAVGESVADAVEVVVLEGVSL